MKDRRERRKKREDGSSRDGLALLLLLFPSLSSLNIELSIEIELPVVFSSPQNSRVVMSHRLTSNDVPALDSSIDGEGELYRSSSSSVLLLLRDEVKLFNLISEGPEVGASRSRESRGWNSSESSVRRVRVSRRGSTALERKRKCEGAGVGTVVGWGDTRGRVEVGSLLVGKLLSREETSC